MIIDYLIISIPFIIFIFRIIKSASNSLKSPNSKFPIFSTVALIYPITAGVYSYLDGLRIDLAFYYGVSNLGYLLLVAGIVKGSFLILGLKTRTEVFIMAFIALATGIIFTNLTL